MFEYLVGMMATSGKSSDKEGAQGGLLGPWAHTWYFLSGCWLHGWVHFVMIHELHAYNLSLSLYE